MSIRCYESLAMHAHGDARTYRKIIALSLLLCCETYCFTPQGKQNTDFRKQSSKRNVQTKNVKPSQGQRKFESSPGIVKVIKPVA
jgi:hypothetical protein